MKCNSVMVTGYHCYILDTQKSLWLPLTSISWEQRTTSSYNCRWHKTRSRLKMQFIAQHVRMQEVQKVFVFMSPRAMTHWLRVPDLIVHTWTWAWSNLSFLFDMFLRKCWGARASIPAEISWPFVFIQINPPNDTPLPPGHLGVFSELVSYLVSLYLFFSLFPAYVLLV